MELKCTRHPLERPILVPLWNRGDGVMFGIDNFEFDHRLKDMLHEKWKISEFFPPQAEALPKSLSGKNLMLAIPTASGKSLVAHITMAHRLANDLEDKLGVYIVPLKALASEKFNELKEICDSVELKVGLAIGDRGSENNFEEDSDVLVCTSEKLDSMLRSNPDLIDKIGVVIADEFHLLQDPTRGPTLEILISRIRHGAEGAQIIALSATVGNAKELAEWLDADLVKSDWRPIALYSGTLRGLNLKYHSVESPEGDYSLPKSRVLDGGTQKNLNSVLEDSVDMKKQMLVFVASRSSAQKEARELSKYVKSKLLHDTNKIPEKLVESWEKMANSLSTNEISSISVKALANAVRGGIGFHHAGLTSSHRKVIEEGFRTGNLLCIVATPTLAQGVNLPASRVVVRDTRRWSTVAARSLPLPVMEVRQMMGRAGRPGFDEYGEAFLISKSEPEEESMIDFYLKGKPELVSSKLANQSAQNAEEDGALLAHILSIVATAGIDDRDSISRFLAKTFLAKQMDSEILESRTDNVLGWLCENGMIYRTGESKDVEKRIRQRGAIESTEDWEDELPEWANSATGIPGLNLIRKSEFRERTLSPRKGPAIFGFKKASMYETPEAQIPEPSTMTYSPSPLGSRVSRLYLNPISGRIIQDGITRAMSILSGEDKSGQISPFSLLHLATCTPDFLPLWPRKNDYDSIQEAIHGYEREMLARPVDFEEERRMKGALVTKSWIDEESMERIEDEWGVQAGDLRSRVQLLEWLLYAMRRILSEDEMLARADRSHHKTLVESIDEIHRRVKYGCKSDILGLVSIRGIGRVRAREMYENLGVESANDVCRMTERDKSKLSNLRGWSPKLVDNIVDSASKLSRRNC